jgi:hypothetical protein
MKNGSFMSLHCQGSDCWRKRKWVVIVGEKGNGVGRDEDEEKKPRVFLSVHTKFC